MGLDEKSLKNTALESSDFSNLFTTDLNQQKHSYDAKKLNQLFPEICTEISNELKHKFVH